MAFKSILDPKKAEGHPWELFFVGLLYSSLAIILSIILFKEYSGIFSILIIVVASTYFMWNVIKLEEKKDTKIKKELPLLKEHGKAISLFLFLFLGFIVSFSLWHTFLPDEVSKDIFKAQINTISGIESEITGNAIHLGYGFSTIFFKNLKILGLAILFSFLFGIGAVFLLTWNASVIGVAIGNSIKSNLSGNYFSAISLGTTQYLIHGIPEIIGYILGALGGGIIFIAVIRHHYRTKKFKHIIMDSADLILLAIFFLFIAATIETYISPLLF